MNKGRSKVFILLLFLFVGISCDKEDECVEDRKEDCICYDIYLPVCGCNGKTYDNACRAECGGIMDYTVGACE